MSNKYNQINTSQKDILKKHLVSSYQLENNLNNFLTRHENSGSSSDFGKTVETQSQSNYENNQKSNFNFSSPIKKLKNLRNKSSAATSTSSKNKSSLGSRTTSSDRLTGLDDTMLFGLKPNEIYSANNNVKSDIPIRTTSLSAFSNESGYNLFNNTSSLKPLVTTENPKNVNINFFEALKVDTTVSANKHPKNNLENKSELSSAYDLNKTPLQNNFNNGLNINDPPYFTPPKIRQRNSSKTTKRFNLMKCCICEESVKEKTSEEKILTLRCDHVCHDSCLYLHMLMEKERSHQLKAEMLFPSCELCNDGITKCIPKEDASRDQLNLKILISDVNEDITQIDTTNNTESSMDSEKEKTLQLLSKNIDYLDGLPLPDFTIQESAESTKPVKNELFHMTPPNQIISVFPNNNMSNLQTKSSLSTPEIPSTIGVNAIKSEFMETQGTLKKQSILKKNLNSNKISNGSPNIHKLTRNRTSIYNQPSISRTSTLSKKTASINSPKPIVKKINSSLPTAAIFSSINTSVDSKPKNKPKSLILHKSFNEDSDSDDELMIVQIEGDHQVETKSTFVKKHSHSNSSDIQKVKSWAKFSDSVSTQTSENLINVVKDRLNLVHELIEKHSDQLNKKNIDSDLGLLRISNVFEVCKVLENRSKNTFYLCKCYLFEKMLILDFFDKRIAKEFQMIKITSESINVDAVNRYVFRVSCLTSTDINIFQFRSLDKKDSKVLEKWISALLNFNLEFYDEPFPVNNDNKKFASTFNTTDKNEENDGNLLFQDFIIKKSNNEVSTTLPIKSYSEVEDLILILQLDSEKKIKISENFNLVNSIKSLNDYFTKKQKTLKFVILDQKLKVLCVGSSKDVLNQLNGRMKFEQIRGKKFTESFWSNSVLQKYFISTEDSKLNIVVMSNTEMNVEQNCLFKDFYASSFENVLKVHVGFLNIDYSEEINDLVEINTWFDLMEILCFSLNLEFGQDDLDNDKEIFEVNEKNCNSAASSDYTVMTPLTPLDFDKKDDSSFIKEHLISNNKTKSFFASEALYNYF